MEKKDNVALKLHSTMDARIWASEFSNVFPNAFMEGCDEDSMIGWFSNALMRGCDFEAQKMHLRIEMYISVYIL